MDLMMSIDTDKLWAYLEAKFEEFSEEYERQYERVRTADNATAALCRMTGECEKRYFIAELKSKILNGELGY